MPERDPNGVPGPGQEPPWDEVRAVVGTGTALVIARDGTGGRHLPSDWSTTDGDGRHGTVVLLDPTDEEQLAAAAATAGDRPLVVVTPHVGRPSYVRALLVGVGDHELPGRGRLGVAALDAALAAAGRVPDLPAAADRGRQVTATGRPLDDLLAHVAADAGSHDRPWLVRRYVAAPAPDERRPFLSVLVRTQGRRPAALADVLLCLSAQTCTDLEVLLLLHDVPADDRYEIDALVTALPTAVRERVRVLPVSGGGRSRPLTVGTGVARGAYLAVLDDDDLVTAHWAETFAAGAARAPGQIVRAVAVEQDVEHEDGPGGHRAASWPKARWDERFSLLSHIVDNNSPVHSYAYPREVFQGLGLRFDESLPVLEDWDLLVRAASLVGVHDTGEVTAVYRRWPATSSSFAEVAENRWPDTAWRLVEEWDRRPLLLPAGSAVRLRREGIDTLRRRPLRDRVRGRLARSRDRWSPRLMRTPLYPALRWAYRRLVPRPDPEQ